MASKLSANFDDVLLLKKCNHNCNQTKTIDNNKTGLEVIFFFNSFYGYRVQKVNFDISVAKANSSRCSLNTKATSLLDFRKSKNCYSRLLECAFRLLRVRDDVHQPLLPIKRVKLFYAASGSEVSVRLISFCSRILDICTHLIHKRRGKS